MTDSGSSTLRIYLDTNALVAAGWPRPSATLEQLARFSSTTILIPEPVRVELSARRGREIAKKLKARDQALRAVAELEGTSFEKPTGPSSESLSAVHDERTNHVVRDLGIESCPFPSEELGVLFARAARHEAPFGEKDEGFRDVVVLESVLSDLRRARRTRCYLVSGDERFSWEETRKHIEGRGFDIRVFANLEDVLVDLRRELTDLVMQLIESDRANARAALSDADELRRLQEYLIAYFKPLTTDFDSVLGFRSVEGLRPVEIKSVVTNRDPAKLATPTTGRVDLSFDVDVDFDVAVSLFPSLSPKPLSVGGGPAPMSLTEIYRSREEITTVTAIRKTLTVQAAGQTDGNRYWEIEYRYAAIKQSLVEALLRRPFGSTQGP